MSSRVAFHQILIGTIPILFFYAHNMDEVSPVEVIAPIVSVLAASLALWSTLTLSLKDARRAGLITSLALAAFFGFGHFNHYAEWASAALAKRGIVAFQARRLYTLPALLAVTAALIYGILKKLKDPGPATSFLNTASTILAGLSLINIGTDLGLTIGQRIRRGTVLATLKGPERLPDIYHIILDDYARSDVLKDVFGYDNAPFLAALERKGFYVARRSTCNYPRTVLSVPSMLNCRYLDDVAGTPSISLWPLGGLITDNGVVKTLKPLGYKFVAYDTGFEATECLGADIRRSPRRTRGLSGVLPRLTEFQRMLVDTSLLGHLLSGISKATTSVYDPLSREYRLSRERVLFVLDDLPEVARLPEPTFTFAHILCPHPPFVFGENGEDVSPFDIPYALTDGIDFRDRYGDADDYIRGYRQEVAFLDRRVERMIDEILAASPEPPIIILQSDHGSGLTLDTHSLEKTDLRERMSILNSYYFPGGRRDGLYEEITPVNSFRVVFNNYFGAHLDLLPDRNYFSTWDRPYRFVDVTDRVRGDEPSVTPRSSPSSR